jgi:hypothetical protein
MREVSLRTRKKSRDGVRTLGEMDSRPVMMGYECQPNSPRWDSTDRLNSGSWPAVSCRVVLTRRYIARCLVIRTSRGSPRKHAMRRHGGKLEGVAATATQIPPGYRRPTFRRFWSEGPMRTVLVAGIAHGAMADVERSGAPLIYRPMPRSASRCGIA